MLAIIFYFAFIHHKILESERAYYVPHFKELRETLFTVFVLKSMQTSTATMENSVEIP